ncbi:MAG TPA: TlpA family protein disulfide reductase [Chloroflexi bacterium]|nr:TlpA family protein disulfide reductase [Chloroflexota bacterium]
MLLKKYLAATLISLLILTWVGCISTQTVTSGQAPDFTLNSLSGEAITLSDFQDQVVILDFWTTWCKPCVDGMPHLQKLHEQYEDITVLAINMGEKPEDVASFMSENGYTFIVLFDNSDKVSKAYGVQAIPHMLIVDRAGEAHHVFGAPDALLDKLQQVLE